MAEPVKATNVLSAFLPKKPEVTTRSGNTETTKTDLNPDAINEIIRTMMESDAGLASLLQGRSGAGLYNSSTSQLMANDLAARVAGKAALASAPTTKTTTGSTEKRRGGGADPRMLGGMKLLEMFMDRNNPAGKKQGQKQGGNSSPNNAFQDMMDKVFGGDVDNFRGQSFQDSAGAFSGDGFIPSTANDFFSPGSFGGGGNNSFSDFGLSNSFGGSSLDSMFGSSDSWDSGSFGLGGGYGYDVPSSWSPSASSWAPAASSYSTWEPSTSWSPSTNSSPTGSSFGSGYNSYGDYSNW